MSDCPCLVPQIGFMLCTHMVCIQIHAPNSRTHCNWSLHLWFCPILWNFREDQLNLTFSRSSWILSDRFDHFHFCRTQWSCKESRPWFLVALIVCRNSLDRHTPSDEQRSVCTNMRCILVYTRPSNNKFVYMPQMPRMPYPKKEEPVQVSSFRLCSSHWNDNILLFVVCSEVFTEIFSPENIPSRFDFKRNSSLLL